MIVEIFKTGNHFDDTGRAHEVDEAVLDHIAENYDPERHEAPVVIGHPESDKPAWGWVKRVERRGSSLYAELKDLVPEFLDMLKRKLFKKRSIALYPDGTLRHVGFLGAMPPAVKGLADISFSDSEYFSFEESLPESTGGRAYSESDLRESVEKARKEGERAGMEKATAIFKESSFSESDLKEATEKARKEGERAGMVRSTASFAERERVRDREQRNMDIKTWFHNEVRFGNIPPCFLDMGCIEFCQAIDAHAVTIEFSEDSGKVDGFEFMQKLFGKMAELANFKALFGEFATKTRVGDIGLMREVALGNAIAKKTNQSNAS